MTLENIPAKETFLREAYIPLLRSLQPEDTTMRWGKMNLQGTVEHMADALRVANAKDLHDLETPTEQLEKVRAFVFSEKPFREGTVNRHMPEEAAPLRHASYTDAVSELEAELADFFDLFAHDRAKLVTNPFFGEMNYEQWIHLLYKHAWHHLRQAGVDANAAPSV